MCAGPAGFRSLVALAAAVGRLFFVGSGATSRHVAKFPILCLEKWQLMCVVLHGAYGYTGRLIACERMRRGVDLLLAGRWPDKLAALVRELDLLWQACRLDDAAALRALLVGRRLVLHAAGPFRSTARLMMDACLDTATHYLGITGEIAVFELAFMGLSGLSRGAAYTMVDGRLQMVPLVSRRSKHVPSQPFRAYVSRRRCWLAASKWAFARLSW